MNGTTPFDSPQSTTFPSHRFLHRPRRRLDSLLYRVYVREHSWPHWLPLLLGRELKKIWERDLVNHELLLDLKSFATVQFVEVKDYFFFAGPCGCQILIRDCFEGLRAAETRGSWLEIGIFRNIAIQAFSIPSFSSSPLSVSIRKTWKMTYVYSIDFPPKLAVEIRHS